MSIRFIFILKLVLFVASVSYSKNTCTDFYIERAFHNEYINSAVKSSLGSNDVSREQVIEIVRKIDESKYKEPFIKKLTHFESPFEIFSKELTSDIRVEVAVRNWERYTYGLQKGELNRLDYNMKLRQKVFIKTFHFIALNTFFYKVFGILGYMPKLQLLQPSLLSDAQLKQAIELNRNLKWQEIRNLYDLKKVTAQLADRSRALILSLFAGVLFFNPTPEIKFMKIYIESQFLPSSDSNYLSPSDKKTKDIDAWKRSYKEFIENDEKRVVDFENNITDRQALESFAHDWEKSFDTK